MHSPRKIAANRVLVARVARRLVSSSGRRKESAATGNVSPRSFAQGPTSSALADEFRVDVRAITVVSNRNATGILVIATTCSSRRRSPAAPRAARSRPSSSSLRSFWRVQPEAWRPIVRTAARAASLNRGQPTACDPSNDANEVLGRRRAQSLPVRPDSTVVCDDRDHTELAPADAQDAFEDLLAAPRGHAGDARRIRAPTSIADDRIHRSDLHAQRNRMRQRFAGYSGALHGLDRRYDAIASLRDRADVARPACIVPERSSQDADAAVHGVVAHRAATPDSGDELVRAHDLTGTRGEVHEHVHDLRLHDVLRRVRADAPEAGLHVPGTDSERVRGSRRDARDRWGG